MNMMKQARKNEKTHKEKENTKASTNESTQSRM